MSDEPETPKLGAPLPAADEADIDREKLVSYALDPSSERGKHKAHVFKAALGIEAEDADYLTETILAALPRCPVSAVRTPAREHEASTWEVLVPVDGLRGRRDRRLLVVTAWEMRGGRPRLATLRVAPRRRQGPVGRA